MIYEDLGRCIILYSTFPSLLIIKHTFLYSCGNILLTHNLFPPPATATKPKLKIKATNFFPKFRGTIS